MGILDIFKRHSDQANQGLDKAGQMVDEKTGNKYTNQINTGVGKAKSMLDDQSGQGNGANPNAGAQGGDPAQPPQS